jgi:hypothetical protein
VSGPENGRPSALDRGPKSENVPAQRSSEPPSLQAKKLPHGTHSASEMPKPQNGVYRTKLWPVAKKRDPKHADYRGTLAIANGHASVLAWLHSDGSIGIRLERITERKGADHGRSRK